MPAVPPAHGPLARTAARALAFARFVLTRSRTDGAPRMAAALAFASLLSLVPLVVIALAVLAAFPTFDTVRADGIAWALRTFAPEVAELVQGHVQRFVGNAGRLSAVGIVTLAVSALALMVAIEGTLNSVFRVTRPRPLHTRLLVHWTAMTLGPLLLGTALSLQGYVTALALTRWPLGSRGMTPLLALPWPTVLTAAAFAVLFATMPNRRVRLRDACVGAAAAAILFAGLRWGFGLYVTSARTYASLYGAMAALPVFLVWTFLSWLTVLVGAEITAALPEWRAGHLHPDRAPGTTGHRLMLALGVLALLHARANGRKPGASRAGLLAATAAAEAELDWVLGRLTEAGFTTPMNRHRHALIRDPAQTSLIEVLDALEMAPPAPSVGPDRLIATLDTARAGLAQALEQPLADVLATMTRPSASVPPSGERRHQT